MLFKSDKSENMEIIHLGHSSFKIKGKSATVVTDPFESEMLGIKFPQTYADIITISHDHQDHNNIAGVDGTPVVLSGPGEYEVKGVKILGISVFHDNSSGSERGKNTIYRINFEGITIVHCGDLGHKFSDLQVEMMDGANILLVPTGGFYTINAQVACEVVSQINPNIIIPMHYNSPNLNQENFGKLDGVDAFLKQMGKEGLLPQPKLVITKDKLPEEPLIVVLE